MSPDSVVHFQRKMGEQLKGKVNIWKKAIEENKISIRLARVKAVPQSRDGDMDIDIEIDVILLVYHMLL